MGCYGFVPPNPNPIPVPTTPDEFRAAAPAFANTTMFPDEEIQFWLDAATLFLVPGRWRSALGFGTILWVEHNLALQALMNQGAANGGIPGISGTGLITQEQVAQVVVSYDQAIASEADAGHWNLTLYGRIFIRYARMFGAGPVQINVPDYGCCGGGYGSGMWAPFGAGQVGPGWRRDPNSNVPVGKYIPTTTRGTIGSGGVPEV